VTLFALFFEPYGGSALTHIFIFRYFSTKCNIAVALDACRWTLADSPGARENDSATDVRDLRIGCGWGPISRDHDSNQIQSSGSVEL